MTQNVIGAAPYNLNSQHVVEVTGAGTITAPDATDLVDVTVTGVTVKLPPSPLPGKAVRIAAPAGGSVTVSGNGHSVRGGATTVGAGTLRTYEFSISDDWVPDAAGSGTGAEPPIGMLQFDLLTGTTATITPGDLVNVTHPNSQYLGVQFLNGPGESACTVTLPTPSTDDDSYELIMDLQKANSVMTRITFTIGSGTTCDIFPPNGSYTEIGALLFVQNLIDGTPQSTNHRSRVLVTPGGCFLDPGFNEQTLG